MRNYTVAAGDSLSGIAARLLDDASRWPEIYRLNEAIIGVDPDLIHPGQTLVIPDTSPMTTPEPATGELTPAQERGALTAILVVAAAAAFLMFGKVKS